MTVLVKERHSGVSHYNPQTGRFLSEDPIRFDSGDYNLYRYVQNRPLIQTDPTGKSSVGAAGAIVCIAAGTLFVNAVVESESEKACNEQGTKPGFQSCEDQVDQQGFFEDLGDVLDAASPN